MPRSSSATLTAPAQPAKKPKRRHIPIDSPKMERLLDHMHQARLARNEIARLGWSVELLAEKASIHHSTAYRFLGRTADGGTKDPKTSTTRKVFEALGWTVQLVRGAR